MDANSELEDQHCNVHVNDINASVTSNRKGGHNNKPKRQMKTPFQLESLEKAYEDETYPSEATRTKLSKKLNLTDRQLQMWFCHRRLKDRRDDKKDTITTKKHRKAPTVLDKTPLLEPRVDHEVHNAKDNHFEPFIGSDYESQCGSGFSSYADTKSVANLDECLPMSKIYHQPPPPSLLSCVQLQAISYVEAQLDCPLREDGPMLGFEFDPLPPYAFGGRASIEQYERNSSRRFRRHEGKLKMVSPTSFSEHQVIRDKTIISRADAYGQHIQHSYNESLVDTISKKRVSGCRRDDQHLSRVSGTPKSPSMSCTSSQSKGYDYLLSSPNISDHDYPQLSESSFKNNEKDEKSRRNSIIKPESNHVFHDAKVFHDDGDMRPRKKKRVNHLHLKLDNSLKA